MKKYVLLFLTCCALTSCGETENSEESKSSNEEKNASSETVDKEADPKLFYKELTVLAQNYKPVVDTFYTLCRSVTAKFMSQGEVNDEQIDRAVAMYSDAQANQTEYIQELSKLEDADPDLNVLDLTITAEKKYLSLIETFNSIVVAMDDGQLDQIKSMYMKSFPVSSAYQESLKPLAEARNQAEEKYLK